MIVYAVCSDMYYMNHENLRSSISSMMKDIVPCNPDVNPIPGLYQCWNQYKHPREVLKKVALSGLLVRQAKMLRLSVLDLSCF